MKKMKLIAVWLLALCMTVLLAACGNSGQNTPETEAALEVETETAAPAETSAETETTATEAPSEEETLPEILEEEYTMEDLAGEYTGVAGEYMGYTYSIEDAGGSTRLVLSADGTGSLDFDGEEGALTDWTLEENIVTVTAEDGSSAKGTVTHGVIALDFLGDGSSVIHYAKEGTDTSWIEILTMEEIQELVANGPGSKTFGVYSAIDAAAGAHLSYDLHTDYLDATVLYEVNAKDGVYASSRTTQALGVESATITFYTGGKVYNLFPADMTGQLVTETSLLEDNLLGMDSLYQTLSSFYRNSDYKEETRDYEGASYTVEVYPEGTYNAETAFYYDAEGTLTFVEAKAYTLDSGMEIPASFYTIHAIDTDVDEAMLDMSAYTLEKD